jgi:hypothetical protein
MEERVSKKTRAGVQSEPVENLVRETPAIAKAAGNDSKLAATIDSVRKQASADLDHIYSSSPPEIDPAIAIQNMDRRIADLKASKIESQKVIASKLEKLRDSLKESLGQSPTSARTLRDIQSDYQRTAYGKAIDPEGTANLAAHNEAQKAVGDAVFEHVTGLDHKGALAAAKENPSGLAARLLKANEQVNAVNKIEAGIKERAARVQPGHGVVGKLLDVAKEVKHSPAGFALSKIPQVAAAGMEAADRALASGAPFAARGADLLTKTIEAANRGNLWAQRQVRALAATPAGAARLAAIQAQYQAQAAPQ